MHVTVCPAGSRGDFQPLLALAVALRQAGHGVRLLASPNFLSEAAAFGVPATGLGLDVLELFRAGDFEARPVQGALALFRVGRQVLEATIAEGLEHGRGTDLLVGGGAQIAGPTIAEALGVPYAFVAFTPQALRSRHHPPITTPFFGLPGFANHLLWAGFFGMARLFLGGPLGRARAGLGLPPVADLGEHFCPGATTFLATDPELAPPAPDQRLAGPPVGALHLRDDRPLPDAVEAFLEAGPPPVYLGFGSMPDPSAEATTRTFLEVAARTGRRLVLSGGWARFGGVEEGALALAERVLAVGPLSHALLFPRVAAVVHHGGAGTTSAAARAGRPQVVVPHLLDQFQWARWVVGAGLGRAVPRRRLAAATLALALEDVLGRPDVAARAAALGRVLQGRDAGAALVRGLEALVGRSAAARRPGAARPG